MKRLKELWEKLWKPLKKMWDTYQKNHKYGIYGYHKYSFGDRTRYPEENKR